MKPLYEKPFVDTADAVALLWSRGMMIEDEAYAARCLSRIGYYRLSAYWYPWREFAPAEPGERSARRSDRFVAGASFDRALHFYFFDKSLRLMLSDALERVEVAMRALLVEVLGRIGPYSYRDPRSYSAHMTKRDPETGIAPLEGFLDGLDRSFSRSKEEFAKHFRDRYLGPPPIWIAVGAWDWGNIAFVCRYLSDRNMSALCARIDPRLDRKSLISWMASLNEVRNACAHHSRLWNKTLTNSPSFGKPGVMAEFDHIRDARGALIPEHATRLYGAVLPLILLMRGLHPRTEWHLRLAQLVVAADLSTEIAPAAAGFPAGWQEQSVWRFRALRGPDRG